MVSSSQNTSSPFSPKSDQCHFCLKQPNPTDLKLKRCSQCKIAWYCNAACQQNDWNTHKPQCKIIALYKKERLELEKKIERLNEKELQEELANLVEFNRDLAHLEKISEAWIAVKAQRDALSEQYEQKTAEINLKAKTLGVYSTRQQMFEMFEALSPNARRDTLEIIKALNQEEFKQSS